MNMLLAPRRQVRRILGWDLAVDVLVLASLDVEYNEKRFALKCTLLKGTLSRAPLSRSFFSNVSE